MRNKKMLGLAFFVTAVLLSSVMTISAKDINMNEVNNGRVYGHVVYANDGSPVVDKPVKIFDIFNWWINYKRTVYTDSNGFYEFTDVPCNSVNPNTGAQARFQVFCSWSIRIPFLGFIFWEDWSGWFTMPVNGMEREINLAIRMEFEPFLYEIDGYFLDVNEVYI